MAAKDAAQATKEISTAAAKVQALGTADVARALLIRRQIECEILEVKQKASFTEDALRKVFSY